MMDKWTVVAGVFLFFLNIVIYINYFDALLSVSVYTVLQ